jgi:hypothetical protein
MSLPLLKLAVILAQIAPTKRNALFHVNDEAQKFHLDVLKTSVLCHLYYVAFSVFAINLDDLSQCHPKFDVTFWKMSCKISWWGFKLCACRAQLQHQTLPGTPFWLYWVFRWSNILFDDEYQPLGTVDRYFVSIIFNVKQKSKQLYYYNVSAKFLQIVAVPWKDNWA